MQKLVGIRGHRGAGKESVAYLLAQSLELIRRHDEPGFELAYDVNYKDWVQELVKDKDSAIGQLDLLYVYLDAFGDAPKAMILQLLGCDPKYMWEDYWKDHAVVDLRTFEIEEVDELPERLISPSQMMSCCPFYLNDELGGECKMSLRDFILYFGQSVMQKYFGKDVWVKSTAMNDALNAEYFEDGIRIYRDIKAPTELTYLIDRQAVIINVERKGYKKKGGLDLLKDDTRWDYNLQIKGDDLMSIKDDIEKIAKDIYYGKSDN